MNFIWRCGNLLTWRLLSPDWRAVRTAQTDGELSSSRFEFRRSLWRHVGVVPVEDIDKISNLAHVVSYKANCVRIDPFYGT
jgi:hypothetical protein